MLNFQKSVLISTAFFTLPDEHRKKHDARQKNKKIMMKVGLSVAIFALWMAAVESIDPCK